MQLSDGEQIMNNRVIPKRILTSVLSSVAAGIVPRNGAAYIAIGRDDEIRAVLSDLENVREGGSGMRFVIGRYGSGKSFLIQLIRNYANERGFVSADTDLTPERRLYGTNGSGVATYRELMKNMSSKMSPEGGAMPKIIAKWISDLKISLVSKGLTPDTPAFEAEMTASILADLSEVEYMVGGFDFASVVKLYYNAYCTGDEEKSTAAIRWLRGEFSTKTEARAALGMNVSVIINDENWYDFIKLWASLLRKIGYSGFVVFIDECVNLYKIAHRVSRENNYEKILSMFNDTLSGSASGLEIIMGGTPQFLEDQRRGLFSYEALKSRLCDSRFNKSEYRNFLGPVIRLRRLSDEELYALISRITELYSMQYGKENIISDENKLKFLNICLSKQIGNSMITPREILRDYMTVLNILIQNPEVSFDEIVADAVTLEKEADSDAAESASERKNADQAAVKNSKEIDLSLFDF